MKYISEIGLVVALYIAGGSIFTGIGGPEKYGLFVALYGMHIGAMLTGMSLGRLIKNNGRKPLSGVGRYFVKLLSVLAFLPCTVIGTRTSVDCFQEFSPFLFKLSVFMGSLVAISLVMFCRVQAMADDVPWLHEK